MSLEKFLKQKLVTPKMKGKKMSAKVKENDGTGHDDRIFGFISHCGKIKKRGWFFTYPKINSISFDKKDIEEIIDSMEEEEFPDIESLMSKNVAEKELRKFLKMKLKSKY